MIIKKHKNKNDYIITNGIFVRNLTKPDVIPIDLNDLASESDYNLFVDNECNILSQKIMNIDHEENLFHPKIIIVSDGYGFKEKHKMLASLPKDVTIIAVNGALNRWSLLGQSEQKKAINYYVVNNPYKECQQYLPKLHRYYPKCIASCRTNSDFISNYHGNKYIYSPVNNAKYSSMDRKPLYRIDDYRNSVCAALSLAYNFGAYKIMLFCCDDSFVDERPSAIRLDNGLYCYEQQILSQSIVEAMAYWLKTKEINISDYSSGNKYINISYINNESLIGEFFLDE